MHEDDRKLKKIFAMIKLLLLYPLKGKRKIYLASLEILYLANFFL